MPAILAVSGSPSASSRTVLAVERVLTDLADHGHSTSHLAVRDLPASDLLAGTRDTPALWAAAQAVAQADGIVIATPIYKASYTGLLKAFLDLLPENALAGKAVLPLVTGGTIGHLLALDYALRPVLTALGASHVVQGRFVLDSDIVRGDDGTGYLRPDAERRIGESVRSFADALASADAGAGATVGISADTVATLSPTLVSAARA